MIETESDEELGSDADDNTQLSTGVSNDIVCIDTDSNSKARVVHLHLSICHLTKL